LRHCLDPAANEHCRIRWHAPEYANGLFAVFDLVHWPMLALS
jgi:hypothetical protein